MGVTENANYKLEVTVMEALQSPKQVKLHVGCHENWTHPNFKEVEVARRVARN